MKKLGLLFVSMLLCTIMQAAVSKTVNVTTAGTLHTYFSSSEYTTVTELIISGSIDARDFKFMRDTLIAIEKIDMRAVSIAQYNGAAGTASYSRLYYSNAIPEAGLLNMTTLKSIILPNSLTKIENIAFASCSSLTSIIIPESVNTLGSMIFDACSNLEHIQFNSQIAPAQENGTDMISLFGVTKRPYTNIYLPANSNGYLGMGSFGEWDLMASRFITVLVGKIEDYVITKVSNVEVQNKFNVVKSGLSAINLTIGEQISIYTLQGTTIYSGKTTSTSQDISLPARGMYIVKVGNESVKLVY